MAAADTEPAIEADYEAKLTKGMEHLRAYVSVPQEASPSEIAAVDKSILDDTSPQAPSTYGVPSSAINPMRSSTKRESNAEKRTEPFQFGSRYLEDGDNIFDFNAWDNVQVDDAFKEFAKEQYQRQREAPVKDFDKHRYNEAPAKFWNRFYTNNTTNFFKDRKWLLQEFPSLRTVLESEVPITIVELGAGAGNTAFPLLASSKNPNLMIHALDYSSKAVELIRASPEYDTKHIKADVWDVAAQELPPGVSEKSVDVVMLIFIFSALSPPQWDQALRNIWRMLKPGGEVFFRDYGRGDLAQVRFKKGRYMEENFYVRGDGTRVYFFDEEELKSIWANGKPYGDETNEQTPCFDIVNIGVDRRMLVNRQRKLKMYRCWMQGRFQKPSIKT